MPGRARSAARRPHHGPAALPARPPTVAQPAPCGAVRGDDAGRLGHEEVELAGRRVARRAVGRRIPATPCGRGRRTRARPRPARVRSASGPACRETPSRRTRPPSHETPSPRTPPRESLWVPRGSTAASRLALRTDNVVGRVNVRLDALLCEVLDTWPDTLGERPATTTKRPSSELGSACRTSYTDLRTVPHPGTTGERDRGTVHRHPAPRMPRPPPDRRAPSSRRRTARVRATFQRAPTSPIPGPAPARNQHAITIRDGHPRAPTRPTRRRHP